MTSPVPRSLTLSLLLVGLLLSAAVAAEPAKKKPAYPAPEDSASVGVLGAHRGSDSAATGRSDPAAPATVAAPAVEKVEVEAPAPLAAAPRDFVESGPASGGGGSVGMALPAPPPTGFLPEHPWVSGLVAGLIGTELGSRLYGGVMVGDQTAAGIGYGGRVLLILLLGWLLFRRIGRRFVPSDDLPRAAVRRAEPSFGRVEPPAADGRREPRF